MLPLVARIGGLRSRAQGSSKLMSLSDSIPNNVDLSSDKKLLRALEKWQPDFIKWWMEMGPEGFQNDQIYLRTAISVDPKGWAHYEYVKMPEYRWGIFLTPREG